MEDNPVFNLSQAIAGWRDSLKAQPAIYDNAIEELESHLRDTMDSLVQANLSEEEAFLIATRRIGHPAALNEQYDSARPAVVWKQRAMWMILGILMLWSVSEAARLGSTLTFLLGGQSGSSGLTLGWIGLMIQATLFVAIGWFVLSQITRMEMHSGRSGSRFGRLTPAACMVILPIAAVVLVSSRVWLQTLAAMKHGPLALGGYYAVAGYGSTLTLSAIVMVVGLWLCWSRRRERACWSATPTLLAAVLLITGCKPGDNTPTGANEPSSRKPSAPAVITNGAGTEMESALTLLLQGDANAAVDAFLKLDLSKGRLFSPGSPLSYSEAEFLKLPRAANEKIGQQAVTDIGVVRRLSLEVGSRRDRALAAGDAATANQCRTQLTKLAERLEGPNNLAISQMHAKAIRRIAAE